jgi:hypothetical protein
VSDARNITELRPRDRTGAERQKRFRKRKRDAALTVTANPTAPIAVTPEAVTATRDGRAVDLLALAAAASLAGVSAYFAVTGMVAIYSAAAMPIMVMTAVIEGSKLAVVAWLGRCWSVTPLLLRSALLVIVMVMMALTAVGTFGFLTRAHLDHITAERQAVDEVAVLTAEQGRLADAMVADLDHRIAAIDGIVAAATAKGNARTAVSLMDEKAKARAGLVAERRAAAERLADLHAQIAIIDGRRARIAAETGPARYVAQMLGWDDGETAVKLITGILVMTIDPAALLLTLAVASRRRAR